MSLLFENVVIRKTQENLLYRTYRKDLTTPRPKPANKTKQQMQEPGRSERRKRPTTCHNSVKKVRTRSLQTCATIYAHIFFKKGSRNDPQIAPPEEGPTYEKHCKTLHICPKTDPGRPSRKVILFRRRTLQKKPCTQT